MKILVLGANGATGHLLVKELLTREINVKGIVRSSEKLTRLVGNNRNLEIVEASILDLSMEELSKHLEDCDVIVSCLGHNLTFKGMFGRPRKLVRDSMKAVHTAIMSNKNSTTNKIILMNTAGNRINNEPISILQKLILFIIRWLIPPHADNEQAASYLMEQDSNIEWVIIRPDTLINHESVSKYDVQSSPTTSAIFKPGKTSRINAAHFMAELITNNALWNKWKSKAPVIYNQEKIN